MKINWDLEHVYFYLVSFISLILIIIGAVTTTQTAIAYITPINEEYNPYTITMREPTNLDLIQWEERFGAELIEQERERFEAISKENTSRRLIRDLVRGITFIAVALPVYLFHWRKIPKLDGTVTVDY